MLALVVKVLGFKLIKLVQTADNYLLIWTSQAHPPKTCTHSKQKGRSEKAIMTQFHDTDDLSSSGSCLTNTSVWGNENNYSDIKNVNLTGARNGWIFLF